MNVKLLGYILVPSRIIYCFTSFDIDQQIVLCAWQTVICVDCNLPLAKADTRVSLVHGIIWI